MIYIPYNVKRSHQVPNLAVVHTCMFELITPRLPGSRYTPAIRARPERSTGVQDESDDRRKGRVLVIAPSTA